jgi:hypothetical protein
MITYIVGSAVGLVVLLLIIGLFLPSQITVSRSITIDRPADAIFPWIAELKTWPDWTVWNKSEDPTLAYSYPGPTTGKGGSMTWTAKKMGDGTLTFTEFLPCKVVRYALVMPQHGTTVHGNFELESAGGGATRVSWYDVVDMGRSPFKKLLGPMLKKMLGAAFARGLQGLKTAAETGKASGPGPK